MAVTLVQSGSGGSATGTFTVPGSTIASSGNFGVTTTAGSALFCIVFAKVTVNSGVIQPAATTPVTAGITWTQDNIASWGTSNPKGELRVFHALNAASVSSSTPVTCSYVNQVGTGNGSAVLELILFEFAGLGSTRDNNAVKQLQNNGTVGTNNITSTATDLVLCSFIGTAGAITQGAAFTAGPQCSALNGGSQYLLSAPGGSMSCAFVGGPLTDWAAQTQAYRAAVIVVTSTSFGSVFGF